MHIILRDSSGRRADAVLLSATCERMRVIFQNENDTEELHLIGGNWVSDAGVTVEIESLLSDGPESASLVWSEPQARVSRAVS